MADEQTPHAQPQLAELADALDVAVMGLGDLLGHCHRYIMAPPDFANAEQALGDFDGQGQGRGYSRLWEAQRAIRDLMPRLPPQLKAPNGQHVKEWLAELVAELNSVCDPDYYSKYVPGDDDALQAMGKAFAERPDVAANAFTETLRAMRDDLRRVHDTAFKAKAYIETLVIVGPHTVATEAPADASVYVLASVLWPPRWPSYKRFRAWLAKHPDVRTDRRGRRCYIHAADFHRAIAGEDSMAFEALDAPAETVDALMKGANERQAKLRRQKAAKKAGGK